jgi:hypothetical protein
LHSETEIAFVTTITGRIAIFAGPTVRSADEFSSNDTFAFFPPVQRGDLFAIFDALPAGVLIIDGYFGDRPAVLHQEILSLLRIGVPVYGAASIGALRAAELATSGMVGLGKVYELFANGELSGDDEVAVLHCAANLDYFPLSIALVELRITLQSLVAVRAVMPEEAERTLTIMRELPFHERTWDLLDAIDGRTPPDSAEPLGARLRKGWVAQKAIDARNAIATVAKLNARRQSRLTSIGSSTWVDAQALEYTLVRDTHVSRADVLRTASLFLPEYPQIHSEVTKITLYAQHARRIRKSPKQFVRAGDRHWLAQLCDADALKAEHRSRFPHCGEDDLWSRCVLYGNAYEDIDIGPPLFEMSSAESDNIVERRQDAWFCDPHGMFPKYWIFCELERRSLLDLLLPLATYITSVNEAIQQENPSLRLCDISDALLLNEFCRWKSIDAGGAQQFAQAHGFEDVADILDAFRFAYLAIKISYLSSKSQLPRLTSALCDGRG